MATKVSLGETFVWDYTYFITNYIKMEIPYKNIPDVFFKTVKKYPNNIFLQIKEDSGYIKYSYSIVYSTVCTLANNLSTKIKRHDKVAILSENRPEWCIAYLSISSLGATAVPLDMNLTDGDIELFLAHSESKAIFVSERHVERIKKICE